VKEARSLCVLLAVLFVSGCGKKGNPLPPLQRIPVAPADFSVSRIEDDVYVQFTVPGLNVDGIGPADIARVELYAVTAEREPRLGDQMDFDDLRLLSTLVASEQVRRPTPPVPPVKEGFPPIPLPPPGPGVDQGTVVVVLDSLTPAARMSVPLPEPDAPRTGAALELDLARPLVAPLDGDGGPQRYYYSVGVSPRGRYGPPTAFVPAPLGNTSGAPPEPQLTVDETSWTIRWEAPSGARGSIDPPEPGLLPSRPIVPGPAPTTFDVYEVPRNAPADGPPAVPAPVTPAPVGTREFTHANSTLGVERCFYVRPVDIVNGVHVRGPASPTICASFADTFPPSPAGNLDAVAVPAAISLIWEPSPAIDLAGYLVLRGDAGSATLTPLMEAPISELSYRDGSVRSGLRYIYAIVAVDKSGNRSPESNRIEETARP